MGNWCGRSKNTLPASRSKPDNMDSNVDSVRKTFKYRLTPTREQARALEVVLLRCRHLYNCALEQRRTWWGRGQGRSATYYQQKAELPDLKAACPRLARCHPAR